MPPRGASPGFTFPKPGRGVVAMMVANTAAFVGYLLLFRTGQAALAAELPLSPRAFITEFKLWQPLTSMFIHSREGIGHLLGNVLMLWWLGSMLEQLQGTRRFLKTYLWCGLGGSALTVAFGLGAAALPPGSALSHLWTTPHIGASGAVLGVTMCWAALQWNQTLHFFLLGPMKARTFGLLLVGFQLLIALSYDNTSSTAHFGGILTGWLIGRGRWPSGGLKRWQLKRKERELKRQLQRFEVIEGGRQDNGSGGGGWGGGDGDPTIH